jgi:hypothetical protein
MTTHAKGPWAIQPDCYDGKEEAWGFWHKIGPLTLDYPDSWGRLAKLLENAENLRAALSAVKGAR